MNTGTGPRNKCGDIIAAALAEDIGTGDITSQLLIPETAQATMHLVARQLLVACGLFCVTEVYRQLDKTVRVELLVKEGAQVKKGTSLARVSGNARSILTGERVALNILQRMCGVATLTARYVKAVKGTKAVIIDTRKTMPGMRALDKYAVKTGGGENHRMGLYDMVLVKDNHLEVRAQDSGFRIQEVVEKLRKQLSSPNPESRILTPIIVECDTLAQVKEAIEARPDRILLDNMSTRQLKQAVKLAKGKVNLEASGGVSLKTVRKIAKTGVDYISVGSLTHSAPAVDIGGDVEMDIQKPEVRNRK